MRGIKRTGGERVEPGGYWNVADGRYLHIDQEEALPGDSEDTYWRIPVLAMLVIAPVLGLLYALFLPFIGLAMLFGLIGQKVVVGSVRWLAVKGDELVTGEVKRLSRFATFGWRPSEAYFNGCPKGEDEESAPEEEADEDAQGPPEN